MEIVFVYQRLRKEFGRAPKFTDFPSDVLAETMPNPDMLAEYVEQNPTDVAIQCIPEYSEHEVGLPSSLQIAGALLQVDRVQFLDRKERLSGKYRAFRVAKSGSHPFGRRMAERCGPERGGADTSVHKENGKGRGLHPNDKGACDASCTRDLRALRTPPT